MHAAPTVVPDPCGPEGDAFALGIPSDVRQIEGVVETVVARCVARAFPRRACALNVPVALTEAIANAILNGNGEDAGKRLVDIVIENNVQAIWLAFGNDLLHWVEYIRASPANARANRGRKPLIFLQVTSVEEALLAANEWKVDVIVAQGVHPFRYLLRS